jgi:hypothetical protein
MDGDEPEAQEEMSYRSTGLAERRHVQLLHQMKKVLIAYIDYLQEKFNQETSRPEFSQLPFRFAEVSKILLDMWVISHADSQPTILT